VGGGGVAPGGVAGGSPAGGGVAAGGVAAGGASGVEPELPQASGNIIVAAKARSVRRIAHRDTTHSVFPECSVRE